MKLLRLAGLIFALLVSGAQAADLPAVVAPAPVVPVTAIPAAAINWSGLYVGVHAGYGWGTKTWLDNFPTRDLALDAKDSVRGGIGGLQLGYNLQRNWLLVGAEGTFSWSGASNGSFSCFPYGNQICSSHPEWISTVTGRAGVALGPALVYAKGGLALTNDHFGNVATCSGSQAKSQGGVVAACGDPFMANQIRAGWTVGGGLEYQFAAHWSLRAEYAFLNFGSRSVPFSDGYAGYFTEEIHQKMSIFTVGLNYHFNDFASYAPSSGNNAFLALAPATADEPEKPDAHVLAFAGVDFSKLSGSAYLGAIIAPYKDLDTSGLRVFVEGDGGAYKYFRGYRGIDGVYEAGSALAGYGFEGDNYSVSLMVGGSAENDTLSARDPTNSVVGTQFGAAVRGEAYYNPTAKILVYTEDQYTTAFNTFYTEGKWGYDVTDGKQIFVGPAVAYLGNDRFNQFRIGAHVSEVKIGRISADITVGYANDSVVGAGAFGKLELNTSF